MVWRRGCRRRWRASRDPAMTSADEHDEPGAKDSERHVASPALVVFKCDTCGDTFPAHEREHPPCPTCGGAIVNPAHEPLL